MSTPISPTPTTPEEIRLEMKRRFDAVNEAAEKRHQQRRAGSGLDAKKENQS